MAVKFFGQFLVERGVVSRETLRKALELQGSVNLKAGEIAVKMRHLNDSDVLRIHEAQRSEDLRFGEIAVRLGLLDEMQKKEILTWQRNHHLYIGEAIRRICGLGEEDLERLLQEFRMDQAPCAREGSRLPQVVAEPQLWEMTADLTGKLLRRIADLPTRPGPCRIVDSLAGSEVRASMTFTGPASGRYLLSVSPATHNSIARAILKKDDLSGETVEILDEALRGFLGTILGNLRAKSAEKGRLMEISPPSVSRLQAGIAVPPGHMGLLFPFHRGDGDLIELALFIGQ
ncbi:chemotaxis protein CheX [Desulfuromonas soudanensis]|uniref:Chemotaxis protein CheX n=1 Tax=Desulfuromonas soudanensis TaxID=1603606 RepID=A0A0M4DG63_9BACT|nr:chemotaxis protein CheX [Desulfuromonas soudanensis]ALC15812.1 chemotaxis protein CheX [Desulfuromonas soudanensis]